MGKKRGRSARWERSSARAQGKDTLGYWVKQYAQWLCARNYSPRTVDMRAAYLDNFVAWCETRGLFYPAEITRAIVERYQSTLYHYRKENGKPLSFGAQLSRLISVRMYFKWLARQQVVALSPASEMELPRVVRHPPRTVLSKLEVEAVIALANVDEVMGLRDRALMEVLYCSAIRRAELANLRVYDVDFERGTLLVREGKGRRDRVVPLGERAMLWLEKYLAQGRPELLTGVDEGSLFLSNMGEPMTPMRASGIVRQYVDRAELGKHGACHLFRHSAATLMLDGGADVRFIQEMLGHANLETTAVYTHVSIHKLKEVHALTHPGAQLKPGGGDAAERSAADGGESARVDTTSLAAASVGPGRSAEVLATLLEQEARRDPEDEDDEDD